ncbi:MAG: polyhydroxyalkanoic acid system family protein [Myxococcota bacterium]
MKHTVVHDLDPSLARKVTDRALEAYAERFSDYRPEVQWHAEDSAEVRFHAKGVTMKGNFRLKEGAIDVDMDVPLLFKVFQKKAIEVVEREIRAWIDRARKGELD